MLAKREIAPRIKKYLPRRQGSGTSEHHHQSFVKPNSESARDSRRELHSWYVFLMSTKKSQSADLSFLITNCFYRVEAESLQCLSAKYCSLMPSPRSTIAAAFSSDGKILASTQYVVNCLCNCNLFLAPFFCYINWSCSFWGWQRWSYCKNNRLPNWEMSKSFEWTSKNTLGGKITN